MRILVIGGTLFIGRATVQLLVRRGHDVTVLHRRDHHDLGSEVRNLQVDLAHVERLTQQSYVEALARAAGVTPAFVSIPRAAIQAAGGHPFAGNLYFGEFLDIPPHTSVVDKAFRVLGVVPTPLEAALRESFAWYETQPRRHIDYAFEDRLLAANDS
jgi:nucleoside-diphosphate-sugar epimerase